MLVAQILMPLAKEMIADTTCASDLITEGRRGVRDCASVFLARRRKAGVRRMNK
jgi:hypothetical protein